jgi:hypothetical protein
VPIAARACSRQVGDDPLGGFAPKSWDRPGIAFGLQAGAVADQVGEDGDGAGVPEDREAIEAEGVEVVAGEEGEVRVVAGKEAGLLVVEEVALADCLDDKSALAATGQFTQLRGLGRVDHVGRDRGVLATELVGEVLESAIGGSSGQFDIDGASS